MPISFKAVDLGMWDNFKKGKNTNIAKPILIKTENQASTCPAKYTPIKLNEKAHNTVTEIRYGITTTTLIIFVYCKQRCYSRKLLLALTINKNMINV